MRFDSALVSTDWLYDNLDARDLVIVDATMPAPGVAFDAKANYLQGHIPGAIFLDPASLAAPNGRFPNTFPDAAHFNKVLGEAGIGSNADIVLYDACGVLGAARTWWMMRAFGLHNAKVLSGGLQQWSRDGRPLERGENRRSPATLAANVVGGRVVDMQETLEAVRADRQIVDARSESRFRGLDKEPRPGVRSGHIPGSRNVPYATLLNETGDTLKDVASLREQFIQAGVEPDLSVICSCGSGVSACVLALALHEIGAQQVAVYDGSWTEWASHPDTPVAQS